MFGDDVGAELRIVLNIRIGRQAPFLLEAIVERSLRYGDEQPDHCRMDSRLHDESVLHLERGDGVMIEPDDESRENVDTV